MRRPARQAGQDRAKAFGMELKLARVRASMLQQELADALGLHATSISQFERGDRADVPDFDTVQQLDQILGTNGALIAAAGYELDPIPTSGMLPLPEGLTPDDIAALMTLVRQLAHARHGGD